MATFDIDINADTSGAVSELTTLESETVKASKSVEDLQNHLEDLNNKSLGLDKNSKEFKKLNKEIKKTGKDLKNAKSGLKGFGKGLGGVSKGFKGVGLAMKAAGIGLVISLFVTLKEILSSSQPVLDAIDTAFTSVSLAISAVKEALTGAFEAQSKSNGGFEASKKVIDSLITLALAPFRAQMLFIESGIISAQLAWENSWFGEGDPETIRSLKLELEEVGDELVKLAESTVEAGNVLVDNFSAAVTEIGNLSQAIVDNISDIDAAKIISDAKATTALKNRAKIAEAVNVGLLEQYDRIAEKDRQIRDDTTISLSIRTEANERLGLTLEKQQKLMLRNAYISVNAAKAELKSNDNIENQVALITARNEVKAVEATIEGFRSEQLINEIGLQLELDELNQIAIDRVAARGISEREFNAKSIQDKIDNLKIEEEVETSRLQLIIDGLEKNTVARVTAEQDLFDKQLELAQTRAELDEELEEKIKEKELLEEENKANKKAKDLQDIKDIREAKFEAAEASLNTASDVSGSLNSLSDLVFSIGDANGKRSEEEEEKRAKKRFKVNKALQLSAAIIDTAKGVTTSLAAAPLAIGPIPNPAGIASLAAVSLNGAATIAKIAATQYKSKSSGSTSPPSIPSGVTSSIDTSGPTTSFVGTGGETGGSANNEAGSNQSQNITVTALVVETDITSAQENINSIENFAAFGGG